MMRMKIQMLAMMFIAALALGACSDDDDKDDVKVPEAMSQALKSKYPSAIHVEWEQKGWPTSRPPKSWIPPSS